MNFMVLLHRNAYDLFYCVLLLIALAGGDSGNVSSQLVGRPK
jgi:hypothetical protein